MRSDQTLKGIQQLLSQISHLADAASKSDNPESASREILHKALEMREEIAIRKVQREFERELLGREGNFKDGSGWGSYVWTSVDGLHTRSSQVYPNAHNRGETFGLQLSQTRNFHRDDGSFRGANWELEDAKKAAYAWANLGEILENPKDMVRKIMES